jgi:NAD(P)H-hydrate epimerase
VVEADFTYSLQFPKLAFLFPENEKFVGKWKVIDIQLHPKVISDTDTKYVFVEKADIRPVLKSRSRFSHKGTFGHALIWAGKKGMAGAAVLASKAALRAGAGLVSVHSVDENRIIMQSAVPEAIFVNELTEPERYNSFAFGPGLGTDEQTAEMLFELLKTLRKPCVLDADALNIISSHKNFLEFIPENSILTPHPGEFERLFGPTANSQERMEKASALAQNYDFFVVLKGANTLIATPDGKMYFNSTGNPGMASGGMGDVLTGIIVGLLAQGYSSTDSAVLGVYLHGLSADLALQTQSEESLLASDVAGNLGNTFKHLR